MGTFLSALTGEESPEYIQTGQGMARLLQHMILDERELCIA